MRIYENHTGGNNERGLESKIEKKLSNKNSIGL